MSGLATYLVGALVCYDHLWIATTLSVASLLFLELKTVLEKLASRAAPEEILTFAKFLLLSAVILPALPNQQFGRFHINPFKTWLVVVAVSTISYGSYVLQKVTKQSRRRHSHRISGRDVFVDRDHRRHVTPRRARMPPAPLFRRYPDRLRHDLPPARRAGCAL